MAERRVNRTLFDDRTLAALDYADAVTGGDAERDLVTEELFDRLRIYYGTEEIVVLSEVVAWENASARFNRALDVQSQGLWKRSSDR